MAAVLLAVAATPRGDRLLVVTNPFAGDAAAVRVAAVAGTPIVSSGRTSFLAVVADDGTGAVSRLFAAGAWLVLDGSFATSCLGTTS
ncbi:MAG: hypothetical protein KAG89_02675 [Fulvimarina manganoxydans]|nr:hypothetical protein [Fulvimarina manganoxydans]